jgi:hypothetical protein
MLKVGAKCKSFIIPIHVFPFKLYNLKITDFFFKIEYNQDIYNDMFESLDKFSKISKISIKSVITVTLNIFFDLSICKTILNFTIYFVEFCAGINMQMN